MKITLAPRKQTSLNNVLPAMHEAISATRGLDALLCIEIGQAMRKTGSHPLCAFARAVFVTCSRCCTDQEEVSTTSKIFLESRARIERENNEPVDWSTNVFNSGTASINWCSQTNAIQMFGVHFPDASFALNIDNCERAFTRTSVARTNTGIEHISTIFL